MSLPTFNVDGPLNFDLESIMADAHGLAAMEYAIEHMTLAGLDLILSQTEHPRDPSQVTYPDTGLPLKVVTMTSNIMQQVFTPVISLTLLPKYP